MEDTNEDPCTGCTLSSRRGFLRESLGAATGLLLALGAPASVAALTVERIAGVRRGATVTYDVPSADGAQIDRPNQVILVRWQNAAYAFALSCPHQNQALRWIEKDARFQCPKHKSRYTPDGTFLSGRATRGMDRYEVRLEGGRLTVDLGTLHEQTREAAAWEAAKVKLG